MSEHLPAVTPGGSGKWLTYCPACSKREGQWVVKCEVNSDEWPPPRLVAYDPSQQVPHNNGGTE